MGQGSNLPKPDVWLLGVVIVQLTTGTGELAVAEIAARIEKSERSALEAFRPAAGNSRVEDMSDFLRQCFTMQASLECMVDELFS